MCYFNKLELKKNFNIYSLEYKTLRESYKYEN